MWNMIQSAAQGRSHIKNDIPCQDKTYVLAQDSVWVTALADGAGSAKLSHFGAAAVVECICRAAADNFDEWYEEQDGVRVKQQILSMLNALLNGKAAELDCEVRDLASTLLFAAVKEDRFILGHIGDGVIGYLKNDELRIASEPENGEFANTTVFTTSPDALSTMKMIKGKRGGIHGFVLMSDGSEASLYDKKEKKLSEGLRKIMGLANILSTEKLQEQLQRSMEGPVRSATTDDCSLVLLCEQTENFRGFRCLKDYEKCALLGLSADSSKSLLREYESLLLYARNDKTLRQIAKHLRKKPRTIKRMVYRLTRLNYLSNEGKFYHTILRMG